MTVWVQVVALAAVAFVLPPLAWWVHRWTAVATTPLRGAPFLGGSLPAEHAVSRFHVRWYPLAVLFLAFDVEMLFMYPWALVVATSGVEAVVEMFAFLGLLMAGVLYAWREGALQWA